MKKPHIFNFRIAYADTDAGGIVYHARYVEIAERARMDMFSAVKDDNQSGGFVIRELNVKYLKPLRLGDNVRIETRLTGRGAATMNAEQKFLKDGEEYAILTGTAVYVNKDIRPARIPECLLKLAE
jgi:acyl-CoA thioester hydrolase